MRFNGAFSYVTVCAERSSGTALAAIDVAAWDRWAKWLVATWRDTVSRRPTGRAKLTG
jgi:hypothetical protein